MDLQIIFQVPNKHSPNSGKPPQIDGSNPHRYFGYFENEHGEQALFVYDYTARTGTLWVGDAGWEKSYTVIDGDVPELILAASEKLWLRACWTAATAFAKGE